MAKASKKDNVEPISNSKKAIMDYVTEAIAAETEMQPIKEHLKDIYASAKDAGFDVAAIRNAVKFKKAESEKQKRMMEIAQNTETYLSYFQLSLF